jgi:hypothetical protein
MLNLRVGALIVAGFVTFVLSALTTLWIIDWRSAGELSDNTIRLVNGVVTPLRTVLSDDPEKAKISDGVSFGGRSIVPRVPNAILRVHVEAYVSSEKFNIASVAVFRDGKEPPIAVVGKPISGNRQEKVELTVDTAAQDMQSVNLEFRIGPAQPGTIVFNGPTEPPSVATVVTIAEFSPAPAKNP